MSLETASTSPFKFYGKKIAFLVGITYSGTKEELAGPINDVNLLYNMLVKEYDFNPSEIIISSDGDTGITDCAGQSATKEDILRTLRLLVGLADPGDSLWFSYSGHGNKVFDESGDEVDGFDETIRPSDYKTAGDIIDDEMHDIIKELPEGCRLTALFDCCHSGSLLDLPYEYSINSGNITMKHCGDVQRVSKRAFAKNLLAPIYVGFTKEMNEGEHKGLQKKLSRGLFGALKGAASAAESGIPLVRKFSGRMMNNETSRAPKRTVEPLKAEVLCLGGSEDFFPSEDSFVESAGLRYGQLTYSFVMAMVEENVTTYKELLLSVKEKLKDVRFMEPQFSTSFPFDVETKIEL